MSARCAVAVALFAAVVVTTSGCSLLPYEAKPRPRLENPRVDLDEFVLVPVEAVPEAGEPEAWRRSIQGQLLDVVGIDRIRVPADPEDPSLSPARGRAFLALSVLHFDPYYPPEAIIEVALDVPAAPSDDDGDILELDRRGRERAAANPAAASPLRFQLRVDADDSRIAEDLVTFAHAQLDGDRGSEPLERVLRDSARFIDFVSYLLVKESFRRLEGAAGSEEGTPDER